MIVIIIEKMTIVNEVKLFEKKNFELFCFVKMIVVVVLVDHHIRIHQLNENRNENHLVQVHHHHRVVHLDRMFNY
jgi:hypothetical protein